MARYAINVGSSAGLDLVEENSLPRTPRPSPYPHVPGVSGPHPADLVEITSLGTLPRHALAMGREGGSMPARQVGEGGKYWLHVLTEFRSRGASDVLMVVLSRAGVQRAATLPYAARGRSMTWTNRRPTATGSIREHRREPSV